MNDVILAQITEVKAERAILMHKVSQLDAVITKLTRLEGAEGRGPYAPRKEL